MNIQWKTYTRNADLAINLNKLKYQYTKTVIINKLLKLYRKYCVQNNTSKNEMYI